MTATDALPPADELVALLARVNRERAEDGQPSAARRAEREAERRFGASRRLAVYGTLAPGAPNHQMVAGLPGDWTRGWVRGRLHRHGWGLALGYPALRWDAEADEIPVSLLTSDELPGSWPRLDRFEGEAYRRILVPVRRASGAPVVANLYESAAQES